MKKRLSDWLGRMFCELWRGHAWFDVTPKVEQCALCGFMRGIRAGGSNYDD